MSAFILLEGVEPAKACKDCPFLNEELRTCELLSRASNRSVLVNVYSEYPDKRCPVGHLDSVHGRILDEKDIRSFFGEMPFGLHEIKYSMSDIFANLAGIREIAPRYYRKGENVKNAILNFGESMKRLNKKDIEKEINDAGKDNRV